MDNLSFYHLLQNTELAGNQTAQQEMDNYFIGLLSNKVPATIWNECATGALEIYREQHPLEKAAKDGSVEAIK